MAQHDQEKVGRVRSEWAADPSDGLDRRPIGQVLIDWATTRPDAPAVRWPEGGDLATLTYRQLADDAAALAARLVEVAGPGRPVAMCAANSVHCLVLEYAAALAGVPLVPLNPAFTDAELRHMLTASETVAVLADEAFRGQPLLSRVAALDVCDGLVVHELARWRDLPGSDGPLPLVSGDAPFLVQFTSGTTGRPKGAVLSHRAAFNCARLSMRRLGGHGDDVWLCTMPLHHVGGTVSIVLSVLSVGASLVLLPAFDPGQALAVLERSRATVAGGVPTMVIAMMEHPSFPTADVTSLRVVMCGGATALPSLIRTVERRFGVDVVNAYGQSESPNAMQTHLDDDAVTKAETIGTPLALREVRIAGPDGGALPVGEVGEMWMRSPLTMDRYVGVDPAIARDTLDADGWLHTGDLCSMDEDGNLRLLGRVRDVVIRGGENIYPAEVEDILLAHPAIADVAVVGKADERWGEVLVAFYRTAPGQVFVAADVEAFARERLASFKVPRQWEALDAFPLTASGKVKKHELRARLAGDPTPG